MGTKEKSCFLSRRWRPNMWPFWVLIAFEFALTVALLTFVGIAAPNLYRTRLWQDGFENGFNSSPATGLYAAANYRPYKAPMVWSQFLTNFNLVIVVLSMFLMLVKSIMYMLHVFPPIISIVVHSLLTILFATSTGFQLSPDTSDPKRPNNGPPWYITKPCDVAKHEFNVGYCQQAKATFGCTVGILFVFLVYLGFSIFSCFPSAAHMEEYREKKRVQREKYGFLDSPDDDQADTTSSNTAYAPVSASGALNPMTPRTLAFNKLCGTKNVPLRVQTAKNNAAQSSAQEVPLQPTTSNTNEKRASKSSFLGFNLRSPGLPRTPGNQARFTDVPLTSDNNTPGQSADKEPMYFPPPPKQSTKK